MTWVILTGHPKEALKHFLGRLHTYRFGRRDLLLPFDRRDGRPGILVNRIAHEAHGAVSHENVNAAGMIRRSGDRATR